jgi:hypothetical protein
MNILDHISESLKVLSWVKTLKFFDADADPGLSGINIRIPNTVNFFGLSEGPQSELY